MKTLLYSAIALLAISLATGCKKSDKTDDTLSYTCTSCKTTPDAVAANDNSNKGIYKGVIIGSSGTIKFDLQGSTLTAIMVIDGVTANLTSTVAITNGATYVAPFTGTLNGVQVSVTLSVGATGQSPTITAFNIPGHTTASFNLVKETSASVLECYEGTYTTTKPETGTFNLILSRGLKVHAGSSRKDGTTTSNPFGGTINANNELIDSSNGKYLATLSGDNLTGKFVDGGGSTVTVTGKRTL